MKYNNIIKGFDIIEPASVNNEMIEYAEKGALKGVYLGFPNMEKHYSMSLPGVTDWTGFPQSGKTQVLMEYLMNTSIFYGWKHLVYFPDVGTKKEIIGDLLHKYIGKTCDLEYDNHITEFEIAQNLPWILEHFKILVKKDLKEKLTPYAFWDLAAKLKDEEGLQTASIDAWKDMKHNVQDFGRDDKYLEDVLSYRNAIAEKHNLHLHTVIHPLKTDKDSKGNRKPPTPYDMKGGTEWYNNSKCSVTVHRPIGEGNLVEIYWNKIKPRSIGSVGVSEFRFDMVRFRYYIDDIDEDGNEVRRFALKDSYKLRKQQTAELNFPVSSQDSNDDDVPF